MTGSCIGSLDVITARLTPLIRPRSTEKVKHPFSEPQCPSFGDLSLGALTPPQLLYKFYKWMFPQVKVSLRKPTVARMPQKGTLIGGRFQGGAESLDALMAVQRSNEWKQSLEHLHGHCAVSGGLGLGRDSLTAGRVEDQRQKCQVSGSPYGGQAPRFRSFERGQPEPQSCLDIASRRCLLLLLDSFLSIAEGSQPVLVLLPRPACGRRRGALL